MKLFSESTNSLKQAKSEDNVDPNYKGEDLPFLIAEAVRTSMEVDGFVHKINAEADQFIMESAESKGIDLESDSEERTSLIMEAAFGEGQGDGIIQKVIDFIKKMYRKVADFVKGILGRFQNVEKLLDKAVEDYARLMSKLDGVSLPNDAEVSTKEMEITEGAKTAKGLFDLDNLLTLKVKDNSYAVLGTQVETLIGRDLEKGNTTSSVADTFAKKVQAVNSELGGSNNEASQHKLLVKYFKEVAGNLPVDSDGLKETSPDTDPKKAVMDAAFKNEKTEVKGGEIATRAGKYKSGLDTLDPTGLRKKIKEGQDQFEEEAEKFDKNAQKLENLTSKNDEDMDTDAVTTLTAALNNYSSVVGVYTSVTTTVYTFAVQFVQEWLNRSRAYAKDAEKVADKKGDSTEE